MQNRAIYRRYFLLLKEGDNSLQECLDTFQEFYHCSGLKMNMEKTQVAWIGLSRTVRKKLIQDLSWVEQFRVLGINFDINLKSMVEKKYAEIINNIEKLLRSYEKRKLSLIGQITVIK